jgi:hypothetical protein
MVKLTIGDNGRHWSGVSNRFSVKMCDFLEHLCEKFSRKEDEEEETRL